MKNVLETEIAGFEYFSFEAESVIINRVNADDRRERPSAIIAEGVVTGSEQL
ncbi:hypothetical protein ACTQWG_09360 [Blautia sp. HCP3S3_H10_1]|uniref:hypothetical protein n=1 Tax=unclassified Blautia TaxID=2648079 RepID=UPI003F8D9D16|nr:hypothetical protein [Clostridia bacterium]